jgi:hypothetical protein
LPPLFLLPFRPKAAACMQREGVLRAGVVSSKNAQQHPTPFLFTFFTLRNSDSECQ